MKMKKHPVSTAKWVRGTPIALPIVGRCRFGFCPGTCERAANRHELAAP